MSGSMRLSGLSPTLTFHASDREEALATVTWQLASLEAELKATLLQKEMRRPRLRPIEEITVVDLRQQVDAVQALRGPPGELAAPLPVETLEPRVPTVHVHHHHHRHVHHVQHTGAVTPQPSVSVSGILSALPTLGHVHAHTHEIRRQSVESEPPPRPTSPRPAEVLARRSEYGRLVRTALQPVQKQPSKFEKWRDRQKTGDQTPPIVSYNRTVAQMNRAYMTPALAARDELHKQDLVAKLQQHLGITDQQMRQWRLGEKKDDPTNPITTVAFLKRKFIHDTVSPQGGRRQTTTLDRSIGGTLRDTYRSSVAVKKLDDQERMEFETVVPQTSSPTRGAVATAPPQLNRFASTSSAVGDLPKENGVGAVGPLSRSTTIRAPRAPKEIRTSGLTVATPSMPTPSMPTPTTLLATPTPRKSGGRASPSAPTSPTKGGFVGGFVGAPPTVPTSPKGMPGSLSNPPTVLGSPNGPKGAGTLSPKGARVQPIVES